LPFSGELIQRSIDFAGAGEYIEIMHISAVEEYGLRCALQLASLPEGSVLAASQVAEREGISVQYASKILHLFRKAGLVNASRGMQGGFRLVRPAGEISLKAVFAAFREDQGGHCAQYAGQQSECVHLKECSVRPVFHVLAGYFDSVLEHLTLGDLARTESEARERIQRFAGLEAERIRNRILTSGAPRALE
jgi:Rrf2 family protein